MPAAVPLLVKSWVPSVEVQAGEVEGAVDVGQTARDRCRSWGRRRCCLVTKAVPADGAVALPELIAVDVVVGGEVEGAADDGEVRGVDAADDVVAVGEPDGAGGGAVGLPELVAVGGVVADEEHLAVHDDGRGGDGGAEVEAGEGHQGPAFQALDAESEDILPSGRGLGGEKLLDL